MERGWNGWEKDGKTRERPWKVRNRRSIMGGSLSPLPLRSLPPLIHRSIYHHHHHHHTLVRWFSNEENTVTIDDIRSWNGSSWTPPPHFHCTLENNNHDTVDRPAQWQWKSMIYRFAVARGHRIIVLQRRRCQIARWICGQIETAAATKYQINVCCWVYAVFRTNEEGEEKGWWGGTRSFANNYYCPMHWTGCLRDMQRAKRVAATRNDCVRIERSSLAPPLPSSLPVTNNRCSLAVYIALYGVIPADCWFLRFSSGIYG